MLNKRKIFILAAGCFLLLIIAGYVSLPLFLEPPRPHIGCHRQLDGIFEQWKLETTNGNWFPNVEGSSRKSLAVLATYTKDFNSEFRDYRYVPGLSSDDPKELILMYIKEPSRRKWHGDAPRFRWEKRWIVINPKSHEGEGDRFSEVAEWIPTEEFTNRLVLTLRYLSENNRNYWTNVVKEHSAVK